MPGTIRYPAGTDGVFNKQILKLYRIDWPARYRMAPGWGTGYPSPSCAKASEGFGILNPVSQILLQGYGHQSLIGKRFSRASF